MGEMANSLPAFAPFDPDADSSSVGVRWEKWLKKFENLLVALNITAAKRKRALLLCYAGDKVYEIFDTFTDAGGVDDYDTAKTKLDDYFKPLKNVEYEIFTFREARQEPGETIDQYCTRLKTLANTCEYTDSAREIRIHIVQTCTSNRLRRRALREKDLTLVKLLDMARTMEGSERHAIGIEKRPDVQVVYYGEKQKQFKRYRNEGFQAPKSDKSENHGSQKSDGNKQCFRCGGKYPHDNGLCPATGKKCHKCERLNHFSKMCKTERNSVKYVEQYEERDDSSSDDEYEF